MKILVADDQQVTRMMLQTALEQWGYEVSEACDGNQAWDMLQEPGAPQLAILDWMMPGRDGPTLCRDLRRQEREDPLYLILLTAKGKPEDIVQGLESGADDYIVKPYDGEELKARANVGKRLVMLQNELRERERLQGVVEMAGAICHEMNQPLQGVLGCSELLLRDMDPDDPDHDLLMNIAKSVETLGSLTRKIMNITRYESKPYADGTTIVDIDQATRREDQGT